jgi:AcrR family transcriptional regulator
MAGRRASKDPISRERWAERIAAYGGPSSEVLQARPAISASRIVQAALEVVHAEGFDNLTMRKVATALGTGPASLYAHVQNKTELDALLIGQLLSGIRIPKADSARWQTQFIGVCQQIRDVLLDYPGIARAALAAGIPASLEPLRVLEGLLSILLAGGVPAKSAAWASDAAYLYVVGYCLEAGIARVQNDHVDYRTLDRTEIRERLRMLPAEAFPNTIAHADELTAGKGHERFDFTLSTLLRGLESDIR